ncbi:MAG TPA: hypothetical protein VI731_10365 [Bacteroidia bacterium]|nr:hypothetical protein [Bacteroidia bacterium]
MTFEKMRIPYLLLFLFFISCNSGEKTQLPDDSLNTSPAREELKTGMNELSCLANNSNYYTAYLPTGFDKSKKYRLVIFFDAHADGRLPLEKYKPLADKWNYIFMGSNVSKNGMPATETATIGMELVDEALTRFPVYTDEIMLCGFSGGARVAANVAALRKDVKGVVCNSAAPAGQLPGKVYFGLAGLGDMNYLEMKKFQELPANERFPRVLLVYDGKHEWAPATVFEQALLISGSRVDGFPQENDSLMATAFEREVLQTIDSVRKSSCDLAHDLLAIAAQTTRPYKVGQEISKKLAAIRNDPCLKSDAEQWEAAEEKESDLQQFLSESLLARDTTWWRRNAETYFTTEKPGPDKFMRERLRGYMSLTCYTYANQAFHTRNFHAAEKMVKVYSIVDPENSEWAYMKAKLYMHLGMKEFVFPNLRLAVALGFKDRTRLQNETVFLPLQNEAEFQDLFALMQ